MKAFIRTIKDIFKIPELKQRIIFTLSLLLIYRLGSFVVLPGIDSGVLSAMFASGQGEGVLGMLDIFVGGAFSRGSVFALGIMPYISASIIVQLAGAAIPSIQKLQREGESGTKKINQITRYITVVITFGQAAGYVINLKSQFGPAIMADPMMFWVTTVFILTAGTMFLVWLGEKITDNGLGNGVSLIIMIGIVSRLPVSLFNEAKANSLMVFFVELIVLAVVMMVVVALTQATRKIPINYARPKIGHRPMKGMNVGGARQYIPLKVNSSNVMPIIFAQAIMFVPATIAQFFPESDFWLTANNWFSDFTTIPYNVVFALLIILFTYFYTAIVINPNEIADQLKRSGGFIPGVKPGRKTAEYIDNVLTRITLPGAIFLALVAIFPAIAVIFGVSQTFAQFFGGTSLLILIGVVLDTLQQIDSYLLMRHYDGLMKSGRIKARTQAGAMV